jgi:hypothetical protein
MGFGNMNAGHFPGKYFPVRPSSDRADYNNISLKSLSHPETESIKVQTDRQIFLIIYIDMATPIWA